MTDNEFDIMDHISEERFEKLKELGYTKETFKNSNLKALLEAMMLSFEKTIQDETLRLMKEHNLSYGEARTIAYDIVRKSVKEGLSVTGK